MAVLPYAKPMSKGDDVTCGSIAPPKEVSECPFCNGRDYTSDDTYLGLLEARKDHDAGHPSETNETPVESVSQPKAVDGYLKEFDDY